MCMCVCIASSRLFNTLSCRPLSWLCSLPWPGSSSQNLTPSPESEWKKDCTCAVALLLSYWSKVQAVWTRPGNCNTDILHHHKTSTAFMFSLTFFCKSDLKMQFSIYLYSYFSCAHIDMMFQFVEWCPVNFYWPELTSLFTRCINMK